MTTDNGAMPEVPWLHSKVASIDSCGINFPLRGGKGAEEIYVFSCSGLVFEGGVRAMGFVQGGKNVIPQNVRGTSTGSQLLHAVDWIPTFIGALSLILAWVADVQG